MSQQTSRVRNLCAMTAKGSEHRRDVRLKFKAATERATAEAKTMPDDREDLQEEMEMWVGSFGRAMVSHASLP